MTIEFDGQNNKITRDTAGSIKVDRKTSDGDIIELQKDGTTVGSIGVASSDLNIYGDVGIKFSGDDVRPTDSSGNNSDNAVDLGHFDVRWQDLYLGGNIYLGGTGSANALDDYEEGTFTPSLVGRTSTPTVGYSTQAGTYTKIGNLVVCRIVLNITSISGTGGDTADIAGLPFTINAGTSNCGGLIDNLSVDRKQISFQTIEGQTKLVLIGNVGGTGGHVGIPTNNFTGPANIRTIVSYHTNS